METNIYELIKVIWHGGMSDYAETKSLGFYANKEKAIEDAKIDGKERGIDERWIYLADDYKRAITLTGRKLVVNNYLYKRCKGNEAELLDAMAWTIGTGYLIKKVDIKK